ncbi:ABC transporter substrate-binding protein [Sinorhizobium meliloti]|uniref:ABC transporter substrate-binding protein n=1 Tax=Rhizobium meliloti TaxID=382 RepID=UPI003F5CC5A0
MSVLAFLAFAGLSLNLAMAQEVFRVGKPYAGSVGYAFLELGVEQGIFARHGLQVEVTTFAGGAKMAQAMSAGLLEAGMESGLFMSSTAKGASFKAVAAAMTGTEYAAIVKADSRIRSIADLKGTTWAAPFVASASGWLPKKLALQQGWDQDSVKIQTGAPGGSAIALLKTGQIDALAIDAALAQTLAEAGNVRILTAFGEYVPDFFQYMIFATDKVQRERPEQLKAFLAAFFETIEFARTHKAETVDSLARTTGLPAGNIEKTYATTIAKMSETGQFPEAALEATAEAFVVLDVLKEKPDMAALFTDAYLPSR